MLCDIPRYSLNNDDQDNGIDATGSARFSLLGKLSVSRKDNESATGHQQLDNAPPSNIFHPWEFALPLPE